MHIFALACYSIFMNAWYTFVSLCVMPCHTNEFAHRTLPRRGLAITGGGSLQLIHYMVMLALWRMPMLFRFFLRQICFRDWFLVFSAAAELMLKGWWVFTGLIGINHNKVGQHIYTRMVVAALMFWCPSLSKVATSRIASAPSGALSAGRDQRYLHHAMDSAVREWWTSVVCFSFLYKKYISIYKCLTCTFEVVSIGKSIWQYEYI